MRWYIFLSVQQLPANNNTETQIEMRYGTVEHLPDVEVSDHLLVLVLLVIIFVVLRVSVLFLGRLDALYLLSDATRELPRGVVTVFEGGQVVEGEVVDGRYGRVQNA